jgi:hypoxanthine phosphoribosyltransferase
VSQAKRRETKPVGSSVTELFSESDIAGRVTELAERIAEAAPPDLLIVALLKGSFVFVADLVRALDHAGATPEVEFLRLSSFGRGKESSGEVRLIGAPPANVTGRSILLVDDILDTGRSMAFAKSLLEEKGPARLWTCALVDKPSRREVACPLDFVGFTVEDVFVVGYGIDYAEEYRHLPYIGRID